LSAYDLKGNLDWSDYFYHSHGFRTAISYSYNYSNQLSEEYRYKDDTLLTRIMYQYNDDKELKGRYSFHNNELIHSLLYEVDSMGNLTKKAYKIESCLIEKAILQQYTYDNWIKKIIISDSIPTTIVKREITYFD